MKFGDKVNIPLTFINRNDDGTINVEIETVSGIERCTIQAPSRYRRSPNPRDINVFIENGTLCASCSPRHCGDGNGSKTCEGYPNGTGCKFYKP